MCTAVFFCAVTFISAGQFTTFGCHPRPGSFAGEFGASPHPRKNAMAGDSRSGRQGARGYSVLELVWALDQRWVPVRVDVDDIRETVFQ